MRTALQKVLAIGLLAMLTASASGQIVILGKDARDKWLAAFFGANGNTATLISGLNANFGSGRLNSDLIENVLRGNNGARTFDGLVTLTNGFQLRIWDTNAAAFQVYDFILRTNTPVTTNVISRVGVPEQLEFKTLDNARLMSNGVALSGIMWAQGVNYETTIAGKSGTNRVLVLNNYTLGASGTTNWMDVTQGVVTEAK